MYNKTYLINNKNSNGLCVPLDFLFVCYSLFIVFETLLLLSFNHTCSYEMFVSVHLFFRCYCCAQLFLVSFLRDDILLVCAVIPLLCCSSSIRFCSHSIWTHILVLLLLAVNSAHCTTYTYAIELELFTVCSETSGKRNRESASYRYRVYVFVFYLMGKDYEKRLKLNGK